MELLKIDCSTLPSHFDLEPTDTCYYWREYTARQSFDYSDTNKLIKNLKKDVLYRNTPQYRYKTQAINECSSYFLKNDWSRFTIIPIPPSKAKTDPLYDDRLNQILLLALNKLKKEYQFQYLDIITQNKSHEASHTSVIRPSITDLIQRYTINDVNPTLLKDDILIFDDILTKGSHFKAIKSLLLQRYPNKNIYGLFIARTIHTNSNVDFDIEWDF